VVKKNSLSAPEKGDTEEKERLAATYKGGRHHANPLVINWRSKPLSEKTEGSCRVVSVLRRAQQKGKDDMSDSHIAVV